MSHRIKLPGHLLEAENTYMLVVVTFVAKHLSNVVSFDWMERGTEPMVVARSK